MAIRNAVVAVWVAISAAGCTNSSLRPPAVDPNAVPNDYRQLLAQYLSTELRDREDFRGAFVSQPVLKSVGSAQRIVVCLRLNGRHQRKEKMLLYLNGVLQQYLDARPEQCGDAAYQPFTELEGMIPDLDR